MISNQIPFDGEVILQQKFQKNILYTIERNGKKYMVKRTPIREQKKMELTLNQFIRQPEGKHPNIIQVYDIVEENGYIFIKMEHSENGSIEEMEFTPQLIHQLIVDIVAALKHLGKYNIFHRDLKPQNIVYVNGHFKLIDFGSAKFYLHKNLKQANSFTGSLPYMSPQVYLKKEYSQLCDIWSFGATLYHFIYQQQFWDTMGIFSESQIFDAFELMLQNNIAIPFPKCKHPEYVQYQQILKKMLAPLEENRFTLEEIEMSMNQIEYQRKNLEQDSTIMQTMLMQNNNVLQAREQKLFDSTQFFEDQLKKCKKNAIENVLIFWAWKYYLEKKDDDNYQQKQNMRKMVEQQFLLEYSQCPQRNKIDIFDEDQIKGMIQKRLTLIYTLIK